MRQTYAIDKTRQAKGENTEHPTNGNNGRREKAKLHNRGFLLSN